MCPHMIGRTGYLGLESGYTRRRAVSLWGAGASSLGALESPARLPAASAGQVARPAVPARSATRMEPRQGQWGPYGG